MKPLLTTDYGPRTTDHGPQTTDHGRRIGHSSFVIRHPSLLALHAFTLVEILVTIALLSFIILGLFAMFNQTQRAFTSSMTQSDVLEAGRAASDMVARDLEQITPSGAGFAFPSARLGLYGISLMTTGANCYAQLLLDNPVVQSLPGGTQVRTNFLEDLFILTRNNQTWIGVGYCVRTQDISGHLWLPEVQSGQMGVGSLYRYTATLPVTYYNQANAALNGLAPDPSLLCSNFVYACQPGSILISNRICDGVVHFHLRTFATNGYPIISDGGSRIAYFRADGFTLPPRYSYVSQATTIPKLRYPDNSTGCWFWGSAVPASVELEFGILEPRTLARFNSIGNPAARLAYLQRDDISTRVHLFRQRIPVRNVDPTAFP